ncbi:MAG: peptidase M23 [Sphingobacteriales bacterium]|nr:MAG: peptidase M23 [Sphingobacteriales bacterium]
MRIIASFIFVLLVATVVFAQQQPTRADLEKRRQGILASIRETEEQLEATKKDKSATMGQLRALQNKLSERQKLIGNINTEIGQINDNIKNSSSQVTNLKQNLEQLKAGYAQSVRYAYKTRSSYDMLAFLFSSNDFNEALRRIKYLKKYREHRKDQANQIRVTQGEIVKQIGVLNTAKSQKDVLLTAEMQQRSELLKESDETNKVVKDLKGKEQQLLGNIEKDKKAAKQLDRAVAEIIRREIEIARKKAEEEERRRVEEERKKAAAAAAAANVPPSSGSKIAVTTNNGGKPIPSGTPTPAGTNRPATTATTSAPVASVTPKPRPAPVNLSLTPEAAALSNSLETSRGRLPWPVEKGFISENFGRHPHPIAEKVMVENNGIDITTGVGAGVRTIFDGTVSKVFSIDGSSWNVIINHGRYFTVYSGLASVSVKKDQQVKTKQSIGTVGANDEGTAVLNFQIWRDGNKMDPAGWIAR